MEHESVLFNLFYCAAASAAALYFQFMKYCTHSNVGRLCGKEEKKFGKNSKSKIEAQRPVKIIYIIYKPQRSTTH